MAMIMSRGVGIALPLLFLHILSAFFYFLPVSSQGSEPGDAASLVKKASARIQERQYNVALEHLNAAIEADPKFSEAYLQRASVLRTLCRFEDSEKNYRSFLQLKPGTSSAEKELSQLMQAQSAYDSASNLYDSADFVKALEYIDKVVLVFSPGCLKAKLLKVKLLLELKDYSGTIAEAGFILKEDDGNLEALFLRGRGYYYLSDHDVALRHFQKGLRLDPEHSGLKKAYFGLKNLLKKTKSV